MAGTVLDVVGDFADIFFADVSIVFDIRAEDVAHVVADVAFVLADVEVTVDF